MGLGEGGEGRHQGSPGLAMVVSEVTDMTGLSTCRLGVEGDRPAGFSQLWRGPVDPVLSEDGSWPQGDPE